LVVESKQILSAMTKPILFVHGSEDSVIPLSHSENAHQLVKHSELMVLENCGHSPHVEKVPELIQALNVFLQD
jgi:pimeloyl-ACP methyl ester carboxylesterase